MGSDRTELFSILCYPHRRTKKVENTSTLYHRIIGSNWNRKLVPKWTGSILFRSDAYFPEWKLAFIRPSTAQTIFIKKTYLNNFLRMFDFTPRLHLVFSWRDFVASHALFARHAHQRYFGKIPLVLGICKEFKNLAYSGPRSIKVSPPILGPLFSCEDKRQN